MARKTQKWFTSGGHRIAAWHFRPGGEDATGTCVLMGNGFSLTRHDGLEHYARVLADAGAHVVAFDFPHLGDSEGEPRQHFRAADQRTAYRDAAAFARGLDGVDAGKLVPWGFSFAGGHVAHLLTRPHEFAAGLMLSPMLDGLARTLGTLKRDPALVAWILPRAIADMAGRHNVVAVTGEPGQRAAMTFEGEGAGFARAVPEGSPWRNEISPGVFTTVALHRPHARAARIKVPLFVALGEQDVSVHNAAIERLAKRAPQAELHRYPYDHFDVLLPEGAGRIAADQVAFLRGRGLL
ncbi:alpha/beta hydrolase [Conexibacter sp. SYSU D00693]|uniref:alpha/beta hydrolase n=1 Tax=Conexibacter sp. SYSU D00693 TaxID=2812560 RepID=UPI00196A4729|nr:alpha/beta fold hydrolase [Conexibacter sp. SYSU D00693]